MDNMSVCILEVVNSSRILEDDTTAGKVNTEAVDLHRILHTICLKCSQMVYEIQLCPVLSALPSPPKTKGHFFLCSALKSSSWCSVQTVNTES